MPAPLTASGIHRARRCPASCALPSVREDSPAAQRGRARHLYLAALAERAPRDVALHAALPELERLPAAERVAAETELAGIDPAWIPPGRAEVAMAYDIRTGAARELLAPGRAYAVTETEIPGTADLVCDLGTRILVVDWKGVHGARGPAHREQLELYALMAVRCTGNAVADATCRVVGVGETGSLGIVAEWDLDWEDLGRIGARARATWERVRAERASRAAVEAAGSRYVPDVTRGEHCRYCPATRACPALVELAESLLGRTVREASDGDLVDLYRRAQALELAAKAVRDHARERVRCDGELTAPDGAVLRLDGRGSLRLQQPGGEKTC